MDYEYETNNSGDNIEYAGGAKREVKKGKLRYDLIPLSMIKRLAALYTRGADIYGERNWEKGDIQYAENCKQSAFRHFIQYMEGDKDEDHMSAVVWNLFSREFLIDKNK